MRNNSFLIVLWIVVLGSSALSHCTSGDESTLRSVNRGGQNSQTSKQNVDAGMTLTNRQLQPETEGDEREQPNENRLSIGAEEADSDSATQSNEAVESGLTKQPDKAVESDVKLQSDDGLESEPTTQSDEANFYVYIMAGQSNMFGYSPFTADLKSIYSDTTVPKNVHYYFNGNKIDDFAVGTGAIEAPGGIFSFGPEISFAHKVSQRYPDKTIIIIKYAQPGTSLDEWLFQFDNGAALFDRLNVSTKKILANLKEPYRVKAVLWMQGESDALQLGSSQTPFKSKFLALIKKFRDLYQSQKLPFIFGKILNYDETRNTMPAGSVAKVRAAQEEVAAAIDGVSIVSLDRFSIIDHWHFSGLSQLSFGECLFNVSNTSDQPYTCAHIENEASTHVYINETIYPCEEISIKDQFGMWLQDVYLQIFGFNRRCVDREGYGYWKMQFEQGQTKAEIEKNIRTATCVTNKSFSCAEILETDTFGKWLLGEYQMIIGRRCVDVDGLAYWRKSFETHERDYAQIKSDLASAKKIDWRCTYVAPVSQ